AAPGIKLIWNYTWRTRGRPGSSSGKTFRNSLTTVPGQMTHLVADSTVDSTRSFVMQGAFPTQGKASSISTVLRVSLGLAFLLRLSVLAMVYACASNAAVTLSVTNYLMAA
nr:hypothetical protein [Tanacetum cinerariifolium]